MSSLLGSSNLDAVNTAFEAAASQIFSQGMPGVWQLFTLLRSHQGTSAELVLAENTAAMREFGTGAGGGPKIFKQFRASHLNKDLRKFEKSVRISMDEIQGDRSGVVAARLADFLRGTASAYDRIVTTELVANPTCYDGQALLANSHPNVNGSTHDNLEAATLTYALFKTAYNQLLKVKDDAGEPLDVVPSHLMVGPGSLELAMQITGSVKPEGFSTSGEPGGTDAGFLALQNYTGGEVDVVLNKRLANEWFLMDCTKLGQGMAPMYLAEFQAPTAVSKADPEDDNVFHDDEALFSVTAKCTPMAMCWQLIHGSVS